MIGTSRSVYTPFYRCTVARDPVTTNLRRVWRLRWLLDEAANGLGGLGSSTEPMCHSFRIEDKFGRCSTWVVVTQNLNKPPVASPVAVNYNDPVAAFLSGSSPCQSDS